jgi:hypothetical protein
VHQQQHQEEPFNKKQAFDIAIGLLLAHQRAIVLICRNRFGIEALGLPCLVALIGMITWASFSRDPVFWVWIAIWLFYLAMRRIESVRLWKGGAKIHSHYDGYPIDAMRHTSSEKTAKLVVEPILVVVLGGVLCWIYQENDLPLCGLPYFFLLGAASMAVVEAVNQAIRDRQTQAMLDARIEQEETLRVFEEKHGEN